MSYVQCFESFYLLLLTLIARFPAVSLTSTISSYASSSTAWSRRTAVCDYHALSRVVHVKVYVVISQGTRECLDELRRKCRQRSRILHA
jgi:hypothetical protein